VAGPLSRLVESEGVLFEALRTTAWAGADVLLLTRRQREHTKGCVLLMPRIQMSRSMLGDEAVRQEGEVMSGLLVKRQEMMLQGSPGFLKLFLLEHPIAPTKPSSRQPHSRRRLLLGTLSTSTSLKSRDEDITVQHDGTIFRCESHLTAERNPTLVPWTCNKQKIIET
jgi:hypothetical protein